MLVFNKEKIKSLCETLGLKLSWVIYNLGVSRSQFENMTYMRMVDGKIVPVVKISESQFRVVEELFICNREDFTDNTNELI